MSPKRGANETPCRGSAKALPYKSAVTSIVGEGLAPPETFVEMTFKSGADQSFRRVRRLSTYRTFPYHVIQMRSISHRRGRRPDDPQDDGRILYRKRKIRNIRFCQADEDTRVQMPYPILLCTLHFLNRRCSLSNALPREHQGTPLQFHCNVSCRGGVLPVGETSRSDSGGGVSAEECSSRNNCKDADQLRSKSLLP